jgi:nucleoside-diphosphate-sugar epimerase
VIGASGRSGAALVLALLAAGRPVQPVVRDLVRWQAAGPAPHPLLAAPRRADLAATAAMRAALGDAAAIVSTAHARTTPALLAAAPDAARLVLLGSTRRFTRWPDAHGRGVADGEAALLASGRPGVMLHPTMIYGAAGENNVQRLAALLRRLPVVPLPGGGRALVQPIHQDDVTRSILAALDVPWRGPQALVIAGPAPLPYAAFVRAVAAAAGLRPPRIVGVPAGLLMALAPLTAALPFLPAVSAAEIRRLQEDKAFDIGPMSATLGVRPVPLAAGLAALFRR